MTDVTASTFRVVKPRVHWARARGPMIAIGACLFMALLSYILLANLSLDPIEVGGETMWVRP
jgi:hypothetical protein